MFLFQRFHLDFFRSSYRGFFLSFPLAFPLRFEPGVPLVIPSELAHEFATGILPAHNNPFVTYSEFFVRVIMGFLLEFLLNLVQEFLIYSKVGFWHLHPFASYSLNYFHLVFQGINLGFLLEFVQWCLNRFSRDFSRSCCRNIFWCCLKNSYYFFPEFSLEFSGLLLEFLQKFQR